MSQNLLFQPATTTANLRDQIQMAIAIADSTLLQSLLVNCLPPMMQPHQIGKVAAQVSVPAGEQAIADAVLHVQSIQCMLADHQPVERQVMIERSGDSRELARMTRYESPLHTLSQHLPLAPTLSLLSESGFSPKQIQDILHLPQDGWHKSWWCGSDASGGFTQPFLRHIRTLHYPDGSLTVQYKDFFEQEAPPCFMNVTQQVLIAIRLDSQGFGSALAEINHHRDRLNLDRAILICNQILELEAEAFIRQGVHVYPARNLVLPSQANCMHCGCRECAMNGTHPSPVALCYRYLPESEFV